MDRGSVLIVDSDQIAVRQLMSLLSDLSLKVFVAFTRAEAIEHSLRGGFDLCLVSHGLSDGSGVSLFTDFLSRVGRPMGVLLSPHANLRVIVDGLEAGFDHIICHPADAYQIRLILTEIFPDASEVCEWDDSLNARSAQMNADLPDLKSIASLSMADIRLSLSNADLIRIIRSVDYPFAGKERLEYFDRDTLERVVCLVRRWGQQRLVASGKGTIRADEDQAPKLPSQPLKVPA